MNTLIIKKNRIFWCVIIFLFMDILLPLGGCLKNDEEDLAIKEAEEIIEFVENNDITVQPTESGLYYIETKEGDGNQPVEGDSVVINYILSNLMGNVFETNIESVAINYSIWNFNIAYEPFGFILGNPYIIKGLNEGLTYMKKGGEATFLLPSSIAFHDYRPVLYQITLLDVVEKDSLQIK